MVADLDKMMNDYLAAWNSHDVDRILSYFTDDVVYEDVALGIINRGKNEVKGFINAIFTSFPDFKIELKSLFISGDWAADEWVLSGTSTNSFMGMPANGKFLSERGVSITELREGKISRNSDYWNMAPFLKQAGLMLEPPK